MEALTHLPRLVLAACVIGCLPGWFWSKVLYPCGDSLVVRLVISCVISAALVPAATLAFIRATGSGVTYSAVIFAFAAVFLSGLAVAVAYGPIKGFATLIVPPLSHPPGFGLRHRRLDGKGESSDKDDSVAGNALAAGSETEQDGPLSPVAHGALLGLVLILVLFRGYAGPVLYDWPFIRGVDQYSHAVMANEMLSDGRIFPYLIYPPGLHTMAASLSLLSGLEPLEIFPLLGPAILLLPALSLYALARRLWGPDYGLAAAGFAGLVLGAPYQYFGDAMYPNMFTSQFLLVLAIGGLLELYARPSARTALLFVLLGSAVILYHQVASLYLAMLLVPVGAYSLYRSYTGDRYRNLVLLFALTATAFLSALYAWDTYNLPDLISSLLVSEAEAATGEAVSMATGTQTPFSPVALVGGVLTLPITLLGLLGAILIVKDTGAGSFFGDHGIPRQSQRFSRFVVLVWVAVFFVGSVNPLTGFPQRFARDLGMPLALLAALAFVWLVKLVCGIAAPACDTRRPLRLAPSLAALLLAAVTGAQIVVNLGEATGKQTPLTFTNGLTVTPAIAAAGDWLREHNVGTGNIMVSPQGNQVPSRMMLAMGHYSAMQSYPEKNIRWNRDLPPAGADAMRDVLHIMNHPAGERTARLLREYDVHYLVLYKRMPDRPVVPYWRSFAAHEELYRPAFDNEAVLIVEPGK